MKSMLKHKNFLDLEHGKLHEGGDVQEEKI